MQLFRNTSTGTKLFGRFEVVIVDGVDEVLPVDGAQLEHVPGADARLMDSIAKLGERLVVKLDPDTTSTTSLLAA